MDEWVLGWDLGKRAACAAARYPDGPVEITPIDLGRVKSDDPAELMRYFAQRAAALFEKYRPLAVTYEEPGHQGQARSQIWIRRQEGYLLVHTGAIDVVCTPINVATLKAFAFRHGAERPVGEVTGFNEKGKPIRGKLPSGAQKQACLAGAIKRGWIHPSRILERKAQDEADAAWAADALRNNPDLIVRGGADS